MNPREKLMREAQIDEPMLNDLLAHPDDLIALLVETGALAVHYKGHADALYRRTRGES